MFSLASLIKFYFGERNENEVIKLNDDPKYLEFFAKLKEKDLSEAEIVKEVLANQDMWQEDLNQFANMHEVVTSYLKLINEKGMKEALISFLNK